MYRPEAVDDKRAAAHVNDWDYMHKACTESSRPNPNMEVGSFQEEIPSLAVELLTTDGCWKWKRQFSSVM